MTEEEPGRLFAGRLGRTILQRMLNRLPADRPPEASPFRERTSRRRVEEEDVYDPAIKRSLKKTLAEAPSLQLEQLKLGRILSDLSDRKANVEDPLGRLEDLATTSLVEALIALSHDVRFRAPKEMLELAFASVVAASNLDASHCSPGILADLQGSAWAALGNACRVNERFECAEDAFDKAGALLADGTGDPLGFARLLDLKASLRTAQRRLPEAIDLLDAVYRMYDRIDESHLAGRALISKGINIHYSGEPQEAVHLLRKGLAMLDPAREPELHAGTQGGVLHALVDCGQFREARQLLLESDLRRRLSKQPLILLRLRWVEGKIYAGLGKDWRAEMLFQEVRAEFRRHGLEYDAALVGLDLMAVWLQQGRTAEVRELAAEVLENFETMKVEREALRAVRFLEEAVRREQASAALVQNVVHFLQRLEWEPQLQFAA